MTGREKASRTRTPVPARPPGEAKTVREMFEYSVQRFPDHVAFRRKLSKGESVWTYAEVHEYVRRLSGALLAMGVQKGDRIAILAENRPEWGVAWFTITAVGAVAVPIDRMLSPAEIANVLAHSGARFAVAPAAFTTTLLEILSRAPALERIFSMEEARGNGPVVGYEEALERGDASGRDYSEVSIQPDDLLTIVYTSGTTGNPKGVTITHANIAFEAWSLHQVNPYTDDDRLLSVLPMNHLYEFLAGFLGPFVCGGQVVYVSSLLPSRIMEAFQTYGITRIVGVPLLYTLFYENVGQKVEELGKVQKFLFFRSLDAAHTLRTLTGYSPGRLLFGRIHEAFGGKLKQAIVGGARMDPGMIERILDAGFPLYVGYGLTETSPVTTFGEAGKIPRGSVGKAIPGVRVEVREPGPDGIGEIVVQGPHVMKGYFRDPERTAEVLRDGWFHTGDLGYLDPDGHLFLTGRKKEMIVTHGGKKLFPDDLERHYSGLSHVKELAVVGQPTRDGHGEEPVAVVVADRDDPRAPRDPAALEKAIREGFARRTRQVPSYQAVKNLVFVAGPLPKTTTFKVKRTALAQMIAQREGVAAGLERRRKPRPEVSLLAGPKVDTWAVWHLMQSDEGTRGTAIERIGRAIEGSAVVLSAFVQGELVGFARAVSDGALVATVADLLVAPAWRRKGIGSMLVKRLLTDPILRDVSRVILSADTPGEFARTLGFAPAGPVFVRPGGAPPKGH